MYDMLKIEKKIGLAAEHQGLRIVKILLYSDDDEGQWKKIISQNEKKCAEQICSSTSTGRISRCV